MSTITHGRAVRRRTGQRLSCRVYPAALKSGEQVWRFHLKTPDGGEQRGSLLALVWEGKGDPPAGYLTAEQAHEKGAQIRDENRWMLDIAGIPSYGRAHEDWKHWLAVEKKRKPKTINGYDSIAAEWFLPRWRNSPLHLIQDDEVTDIRTELVEAGMSASRLNEFRTVLRGPWRRAQDRNAWGYQGPNASLAWDWSAVPDTSFAYECYEPWEIALLVAKARRHDDADLFIFAAYTGLRLGELLALRWRAIRWRDGKIDVLRAHSPANGTTTPKSGKGRDVPIAPMVAEVLIRLAQRGRLTGPDDLVFPGPRGGVQDGSALYRRYQAAGFAAGLQRDRGDDKPLRPLPFHSLRHTFGTLAVRAWGIYKTKYFMGHASVKTTERYARHLPGHDDAIRLDGVIKDFSAPVEPTALILPADFPLSAGR